jgi:hypothetical protein
MPSSKKSKTSIVGMPWSMSGVWNDTLDIPEERPFIARDYCYASELGGAFCDRYLKMYAVKMSNPPNTRSRRKFQAGNMWEWVMGMVLISAGMLKKKQIRVEAKFPKLLRVSGRLDFVVGAPDNWDEAKANIQKVKDGLDLLGLDLPPFFFRAIDKFVDKYKGMKIADAIVETKSLSSFMMEKVQKTEQPLYHHSLQNFHYVHGNDLGVTFGKLFYVSKDDCLMQEFDIHNSERLLQVYKNDIKTMTKYYNAGFDKRNPKKLMPPLEPLVLFEEGVWKFSKNWNVEYSNYLEYLYGYATPEAYRMAWQYKVNSWNRVIKRAVLEGTSIKREGKPDLIMKLTDKNFEAIADVKKYFPQWDKYVAKAKAAGAFQKPEEGEDDE